MPVRQSCPGGHSWHGAALAAPCPTCGAIGFASALAGEDWAQVLTGLLGRMGDGFVAIGPDGRVAWNDVAEQILGTIPVGRAVNDWPRHLGLVPTTNPSASAEDWPLARALLGHTCDDVDLTIRNDRSASAVHLRASARPLRDQGGELCGGVLVFRDLTTHRRDEQHLRATRLLFDALLEHCPDAIFFKDAHGRYLRVNRAMAGHFGLTDPEQAINRSPTEFFHPDYIEQIQAAEGRVLRGEATIVTQEEQAHWLDGRRRWMNAVRMPLQNDKGQVIGTFGIVRDISERKQTMEALRASEARSRLLFEHSPDAIFVLALDGTILDVNPAACTLHDRQRDDLLGHNLLELVPPGYKEEVADDLDRLARPVRPNSGPRHVEGYAWTRGGKAIPVELNASIFDMGDVPCLLIHVRDLTERRRADEQLLKLSRAVEQTADAVFITDRQGTITYVNPAFEEMTGYSQSEAIGQTPRLVKSGRHDRAFFAQMWSTLLAGRTFRGVITNRRKSGDLFTADVTISPLKDVEGLLSHFVATWKDISEAKRAEQELRRSRERYELAVQGSKDGLWDWDISRGEVYFSPRWKSMLGYADTEIANRFEEWASRLHPEDHRPALAKLHAYMDGLIADYELEHRLRHKDGTWRWILARGVAFRDPDGRPYRMAGSHTDITERKRAEETLRRAMEAAESASRAKSEFLANVSHEIRTPLNGILGLTELTLQSSLTDTQRDYLTLVRSSTHALLGIVHDLLDFSRIEAGRMELDPQEFSLREELVAALRTQAPRAYAKGLDLVYRVDDAVADRLIADWPRLRQILVNLIGNAIKFTEAGEVVVTVTSDECQVTSEQPSSTRHSSLVTCHFSVRDTGIGIPPDKLQAVFEPFVQADGSMARKYGGTGLGLSISARLAALMGGSLAVDSVSGQGSTFRFEVVLQTSAATQEPPRPSCPAVAGRSALIVIAGNAERQLVRDLLTDWGAEVVAVADAMSALAELERAGGATHGANSEDKDPGYPGSAFEVVILDVRIAGGPDGPTQRLTAAAGSAGFVVLYPPFETDGGGFLDCPGGIALTRPIRPEDLARALTQALDQGQTLIKPVSGPLPAADGNGHVAKPSFSRPLKLLVAEDNNINQRLMRDLLGKMGHHVELAVNGIEALAACARSDFDAVFMDVQMPGMDGLEACRRLRAAEEGTGRHLPVIAVTAHARKEHRDLCLAVGMDGYLVKPIDIDNLVRTLADLSKRLASDEVPQDRPSGRPPGKQPTVPETRAPAVVNVQAALARVGGDVHLLNEMMGLYRHNIPHWRQEVRAALQLRDAQRLRRVAHTVKGAVSIFGAEEAVQAAESLEELALAVDLDGADGALDNLETALARLDAALPGLCTASVPEKTP